MYTVTRKIIKVEELVAKTSNMITPFQRKNTAWNSTLKKEFIIDVLTGKYIPEVVTSKQSEGVYFVLDGLQRISTLDEFIKGKIKIDSNVNSQRMNIEKLKNTDASIALLEDMTSLEELELFVKLNTNKVQLSAAELRRASKYNNVIMRVFNEDLKGVQSDTQWAKDFYDILTNNNSSKIEKLQARCTDEDIMLTILAFSYYNAKDNIIKGSKNKFLDQFVDGAGEKSENLVIKEIFTDTLAVRHELATLMEKVSLFKDFIITAPINQQLIFRGVGMAAGRFELETLKVLRKDIEETMITVDGIQYHNTDNRNTVYWNNVLSDLDLKYKKLKVPNRVFNKNMIEKKLESKVGNALYVTE